MLDALSNGVFEKSKFKRNHGGEGIHIKENLLVAIDEVLRIFNEDVHKIMSAENSGARFAAYSDFKQGDGTIEWLYSLANRLPENLE
jgi:hypothetical protein